MTDYYAGTYTSAPVPPFRFDEAYVLSQDISALQAEVTALGYVQDTVPVVDLRAHPADYVTMTGVFEALEKGPQSHAERRNRDGRVPVWALVCLFVGFVLVGLSMVGYAFMQNM